MYTGKNHLPERRRHDDSGFTLVELLIVIVILGILATVTVFAVRGITDTGQENSEAADLRTMETAIEGYYALNRANPADEATLASSGLLAEESTMHDYTLNGDGTFTITNVRTGAVVGSGAAAGGGGGGGGGGGTVWTGTANNVGAFTLYTQSNGSASDALFIGGASALAAWDADLALGQTLAAPFNVHAISTTDIADLTELQALVDGVAALGYTEVVFIMDDDVADFCNIGGDDYPMSACADYATDLTGTMGDSTFSTADITSMFFT